MKKQIRKCVFETNSSSVHAIAIAKNVNSRKLEFPEKVQFEYGEFGWEQRTLDTTEQKSSYLYTSMVYHVDLNEPETIKKWIGRLQFIVDTLAEYNVGCEFSDGLEIIVYSPYGNRAKVRVTLDLHNYCYVDHGEGTKEFVEAVCSDKNLLVSYLFSPKSFVLTGNDNDDTVPHIHVDYECVEFYK